MSNSDKSLGKRSSMIMMTATAELKSESDGEERSQQWHRIDPGCLVQLRKLPRALFSATNIWILHTFCKHTQKNTLDLVILVYMFFFL